MEHQKEKGETMDLSMQMDNPIFFFVFWICIFLLFVAFILLLCFCDFADLLFCFSFFFFWHVSRLFSSLLILRINNGLVNITIHM